jgi:hypothetical protein
MLTDEKSADFYSIFPFYKVEKNSNINLWKCLKGRQDGRGTLFKTTRVVFLEQHFRVITEAVRIRLWSEIQAFQICSYVFRLLCVIFNNHFSFRIRRGSLRGQKEMNIYDTLLNRAHGSMLYPKNFVTSRWKESECLRNSTRLQNSDTRNTTGSHAGFVHCEDVFKFMSRLISYHGRNCLLTLSDPTSDLVRQYDFPVLLRCRKTSGTVFVASVRPLSEPVRRFSSCSTDFSQQIERVVLFLFLHVFPFKTVW